MPAPEQPPSPARALQLSTSKSVALALLFAASVLVLLDYSISTERLLGGLRNDEGVVLSRSAATPATPPGFRALGCFPRVPDADYELCQRHSRADCPTKSGPCKLSKRLPGNFYRCLVDPSKLPARGPTPAPTVPAGTLCVPPSECRPVVLTSAVERRLPASKRMAPSDFVTRLGLLVDQIYVLCGGGCDSDSTRWQVPESWLPRVTLLNGSAHDECLGIRGMPHNSVALQSHKGAVRDAQLNGYGRVLIVEHDNVWIPPERRQPWSEPEWDAFSEFFRSDRWEFIRLAYEFAVRGERKGCLRNCECKLEPGTRWCTVRPNCDVRSAAAYVISSEAYGRFVESEQPTVDVRVFREFSHTLLVPLLAHQRVHSQYTEREEEAPPHGRSLGQGWRKTKEAYMGWASVCMKDEESKVRSEFLHRNYFAS